MAARKYLDGQRFGRLVVLEEMGKNNVGHYIWRCQCECGNICNVSAGHLTSGHTISCGCFHKEQLSSSRRTHGMAGTRTYLRWSRMLSRCYYEKTTRFESWGGRGIKVCDRWHSFEAFYEDMGECPPKMSLDRLEGDMDYKPGNCKWSTPTQQAWNRKTTRWISLCGESVPLKEACVRVGISDRMVHKLVSRNGISHTEAFYDRLYEKLGDSNDTEPFGVPDR